MDPIPAWVRSLWDVWNLRMMVLLSLTLQIILSLFGKRRKYISSLWINVLLWLAYLMADWVATVALGKLSDSQSDHENRNALWGIWAPLLLLHLGGPDSITAYALEDNQLWMRHFFGLVVQFSVVVYVILMSWKNSWFQIMSIPALVAGFIKYGERTWVLMLVSYDKFTNIVPFDDVGGELNVHDYSILESKRVLCFAHKLVKNFRSYMRHYDLEYNKFDMISSYAVDDSNLFWKALEVEMGLMFDLLYTKAAINYDKVGWILRCITFGCTLTVLVGLIFRLIFIRENREKWHDVDIAITVILLAGALALETYGIIVLYLSSDWAMLWQIKHKRGEKAILLRKTISPPKQYWSKTMGQFNLFDYYLERIQPDQNLSRRIPQCLLGLDHYKDKFKKYINVDDLALFNEIIIVCELLSTKIPLLETTIEWAEFSSQPLEWQIVVLHMATEVCYNMETEWDTDDASKNNTSTTVSQHTSYSLREDRKLCRTENSMSMSDSSSKWEENKKLCRTVSHYMMHLLVMCPSLLPVAVSDLLSTDRIRNFKQYFVDKDVKKACRALLNVDNLLVGIIGEVLHKEQKYDRWKILKFMWLRILCYAASKGPKNEHLRQLTQGGELITLLWFFLPQSHLLRGRSLDPRTIAEVLNRGEII